MSDLQKPTKMGILLWTSVWPIWYDICLDNWIKGWVPHLLGSRYHSAETSLELLSGRVSVNIQVCIQLGTKRGRGQLYLHISNVDAKKKYFDGELRTLLSLELFKHLHHF